MKKHNVVLTDGERQVELYLINPPHHRYENDPHDKNIEIKCYSEGAAKSIRIELQPHIQGDCNLLNSSPSNAPICFEADEKHNHSQLIDLVLFLINVSHPIPQTIQGYYINIISNLLSEKYFNLYHSANEKKVKMFMSLTQYINANMRNDIRVKDLMDVSNMSERSLYYLFKESVSLTPLAYIRKRKIEHVYRQLTDKGTQLSITKLAMDFGFTNLGRFANLYREQVGELPSETRMKYSRNRAAR